MEQNLSPDQIENVITSHPGVVEVAAVSVPDEILGEVVGVWIVRKAGTGKEMTREAIQKCVTDGMNPQVGWLLGLEPYIRPS